MRVLALFLVACQQQAAPSRATKDRPHETPSIGDGELDSMQGFVRVETGVPIAALQPWLIQGSYRSWAHESKRHPSSGPHAEEVVTFLSPLLEASLRANAKAHPSGAAAVKELFKGGALVGWAVSVKTAADSAAGKNWFWYETLSTAPDAKAPYQGLGVEICRDCHAESGGVDQVLIEFPLR